MRIPLWTGACRGTESPRALQSDVIAIAAGTFANHVDRSTCADGLHARCACARAEPFSSVPAACQALLRPSQSHLRTKRTQAAAVMGLRAQLQDPRLAPSVWPGSGRPRASFRIACLVQQGRAQPRRIHNGARRRACIVLQQSWPAAWTDVRTGCHRRPTRSITM